MDPLLVGASLFLLVALGFAGWVLHRTRNQAVQEFQKQHPPHRGAGVHMSSSVHFGSVNSGRVTLDGMTFVIKNGRVTVNGQPWGPVDEDGAAAPLASPPKVVLNQDGTITGPIQGTSSSRGQARSPSSCRAR